MHTQRRATPLRRLDDPDYPALAMSQAAELLGVQAAFLRSLDAAGVLPPHRSAGGHRRYSRPQLGLAARLRQLLDDGHTLASAGAILTLQDELADAPRRRRPAAHRAATGPRWLPVFLLAPPCDKPQGGMVRLVACRRRRISRRAQHRTVPPHGYIHHKDDYLKRLRRIEGQVRGLQRMVEEEKYCIDILTQVSAMTKALQSVALGLLEEHLGHCVVERAAAGGREAEEKIREASDAIARLVRS